ncbi:hypothetical protein C5469_17440 [Photorhabdus cinerea]|uniref:Uncharacterized protein n=1 Tax=Photorhabdus cinerea TaxID=471575 RepID=A0A7X5THG7_9GAMM|nr:hypothetical protein [Photorhabdus cinerea]
MNARFFMIIIFPYLMSILLISSLAYGKNVNDYISNRIKDFFMLMELHMVYIRSTGFKPLMMDIT